jgi:DNA replication protein DnaC
MKSLDQVDELLARRKAWVAKNGSLCGYGLVSLRLLAGDRVGGGYGWTQREIEQVPDTLHLPTEEKLAKVRAFWFAEWQREDAERIAKARADEWRRAAERAQNRWDRFGPPGKYRLLDEDSYRIESHEQRDALAKVLAFPWADESFSGSRFATLALLGTPGTGKTHLASIWLREHMIGQGMEGQFITAAQLVREIRRAWDERGVDETKVLERFGSLHALVIDDVGVDTSEGAVRLLVEVLDQRLANEMPTCITSNATPTQLREIFGPRGFSRVMANAQLVVLKGPDARLLNCRKEQDHAPQHQPRSP